MEFYSGKLVAVTGSNGFLAQNLIRELLNAGARVRGIAKSLRSPMLPSEVEYFRADLRSLPEALKSLKDVDLVFHLAASGGGFHANLSSRCEILTNNLLLNTATLEASKQNGVNGYLFTSSFSVYPPFDGELNENVDLGKPPSEGESPLGWSKRMGEIQAQEYFTHYGIPIAIVRPCNPYGPYDHFDSQKGHVVPALIKRVLQGESPLVVRGSGKPVRSFIYATDAAKAMMVALAEQANAKPINLAVPEKVSIEVLAGEVLQACKRDPHDYKFDSSFPDGPAKRIAGSKKAEKLLGLNEFTSLRDGLSETVQWYKKNNDDNKGDNKDDLTSLKDLKGAPLGR